MRLSKKILLPYVVQIIFLACVSLYVVFRFSVRQYAFTALVETLSRQMMLIDEMGLLERELQTDSLSYVMTRDPATLVHIRQLQERTGQVLSALGDLTEAQRGMELLDAYAGGRAKTETMRQRLMEAVRKGEQPSVNFYMDKWLILARLDQARIADFSVHMNTVLHRELEMGGVLTEEIIRLLLILTLIAILFLLFLSFYLRVSVVRPLAMLTERANKIAGGQLHVPVGFSGRRDEIGELGAAFADMARQLQATYANLERRMRQRSGELAVSQEQFKRAFQDSSVGMMLLSPAAGWINVNRSALDFLGYGREELFRHEPRSLVHEEDSPAFIEELGRLLSGEMRMSQMEVRLLHRKGFPLWTLFSVSVVRSKEGKPLYFIAQMQDIHRRKVELLAQSEFVALASHQLRTPLTALRWALGRAVRVFRGASADERLLREAYKASTQLAAIIDAMLTISRIEAGKVRIQQEAVHVRDFLYALKEENRDEWAGKHLTVSIIVPPQMSVHTDRDLFHECVMNLFSNAIKYTPQGGAITLEARREPRHVILSVSDTGFGIPDREQQRVFTKFFRGENVVLREPNGTGLGLYLVYIIVRILGGHVSFRSREGQGTTFTVALPEKPSDH
ncbi:MAG: ATP-binding protein [Candidatus Peribacteraceae bacterium]|nr:ATP-binding protein [Candidatus Peribacteraceae bacterium]